MKHGDIIKHTINHFALFQLSPFAIFIIHIFLILLSPIKLLSVIPTEGRNLLVQHANINIFVQSTDFSSLRSSK